MTEQRRLAAIVSADVAGYSRLTGGHYGKRPLSPSGDLAECNIPLGQTTTVFFTVALILLATGTYAA